MSAVETVKHHLEIYTATQRWVGDLALPSMRRLSDFFNDKMHDFFNLSDVTLSNLHQGIAVQEATYPAAALRQQAVIAVVRETDPSPAKADALQRVQKQPFAIQVHAPPFVIEGNLHLLSGGQILDALNASRQEYIVLTEGMIAINGMSLLPLPAELILVNRAWMTAFRARS